VCILYLRFSFKIERFEEGRLLVQKTVFGGQPTKPDYEFVASAVFWYVDHLFMMKRLNCVILLYLGLEGLTGVLFATANHHCQL
jgi:hypothetical protein